MRLPLIEALTSSPVPEGSSLLVEFDAASQWYNASITIAAGWFREGGGVSYSAAGQTPERVRVGLSRLGLDPVNLEKTKDVNNDELLRIWDWYSASTGSKSSERLAVTSLKVSDLSIFYSQQQLRGPPLRHRLQIMDDVSILARFNEEKNWVEFSLSRLFPMPKIRKSTAIGGLIRGVHSEWVYRRHEAAADGIIEFKVDELQDPPQHLIRVKAMRDVGFDGRWHAIKVRENQEVMLQT